MVYNFTKTMITHHMNYTGKGKSIWDVFSQEPGHVDNNDNGNIACDSYHNYRTDVQLLKNLKV